MFKRPYLAVLWRERNRIENEVEYLRPIGNFWEIWSKDPLYKGPGLGKLMGQIGIFENESAAKTNFDRSKENVVYSGGELSMLFVKAVTRKGAAENALGRTGELINNYQQDRELARELSLQKWTQERQATIDSLYLVLQSLEAQAPKYGIFALDSGEDLALVRRSLQSRIDGYVLAGAVTEAEVSILMSGIGLPFYKVNLPEADILAHTNTTNENIVRSID